jgi:hypothetical protein
MVLQHHAMMPLLKQLQEIPKLSMQRNATWTLSNFCRGKPQPDFHLVSPALPTLANLIHSQALPLARALRAGGARSTPSVPTISIWQY